MERFIYRNSLGNSVTIGYDDKYILAEYDGLTATEIIPTTTQSYKQNGYSLHSINIGTRIITLSFFIHSADMKEAYQERKNLATIFNPLLGAGVLEYENDYTKMAIECIVSSQPQPVERMGFLQQYEVELTAFNPFWRDTAETGLLMAGFTGGISFPLVLNGDTTFAEKSALTTINNVGDIPASIRAEFFGECSNPVLLNTTTGKKIQVNTSIGENERLIITTGYGDKAVKKVAANGDVTNAYHLITLDSSFWDLERGTNKITFSSDTGTPEVFIYYYNWYMGV